MDVIELFEQGKNDIEELLQLMENKKETETWQQLQAVFPVLNEIITLIQNNELLSQEDSNEMLTFFEEAIKNRDLVLLEDILQNAFLDVINQIIEYLGETA